MNWDFAGAVLTHWGRVTHICVSKLTIISSENCLSPGRRQAIIWTNAGILLMGPLGTNFSEILVGIETFFVQKNALESVNCVIASILSRPQWFNISWSRQSLKFPLELQHHCETPAMIPLPQRSLWHNKHWTVALCWFSPVYAGTRKTLMESPLFKCNSSDSKHGRTISHKEAIHGNYKWIGWKIKTSTCNDIMFNFMNEFWYPQLSNVTRWYKCTLQYVYGSRSVVLLWPGSIPF